MADSVVFMMMRTFTLALGLILAACVATNRQAPIASATAPLAEIPYRIDEGGWIIVSVRVNGEGPYDFIVDSAATRTAVYQRLADQHEFKPAQRPRLRVLGLTETRYLPAWEIGDVEIGGVVMRDHEGVVLDDWPAPLVSPHGVLGLDFLARFVIRIDTERQIMALYAPGAFGAGRDYQADAMPLHYYREDDAPLFKTTVYFNRRNIDCIVDTGSALSVVNARALSAMTTGLFIENSPQRGLRTGSRLNDVFGTVETAGVISVPRISLGPAKWWKKRVVIFSADIFRELGVERRAYCILGADLLTEQPFILDFPGERIIIEG